MAKILPILTNGDPILRKKSKEIEIEELKNQKFQQLCQDMKKTMKERDGVGLAAPQIGKNIRIIVINTEDGVLAMVNPRISKKSWAREWGEEGCLSVPKTFGEVRRHKGIDYLYFDEDGKKIKGKAKGMLARVIQHEMDHLDGILFIDKARNVEKIK